jgi:phosphatidylinositol alpha-mannosyltransferase
VLTPGGVRIDTFFPSVEREPVPTLLYSGVLNDPRKGVAMLLEAVAIMARTEPGLRLWLSGPGDAESLLSKAPAAARERTEVLPLGTPEDQPKRYSAAWATVLPSIAEAFGLSLVESLACGTPIVAVADAALPELARTGIGSLSPPGDASALAAACVEALGLSKDAGIRERCREASQAYDWDAAVAPAVEAIYESGLRAL